MICSVRRARIEDLRVGRDLPASDDHPQRLMLAQRTVGVPGRQRRIVGQDGSGADHDGVDLRPLVVYPLARRAAGDPLTGPVRGRDPAVDGRRELRGHHRSPALLPEQPLPQRAVTHLVDADTGLDRDTGLLEPGVTSAGHTDSGPPPRRRTALHAGRDQCLGARTGAAGVVAGFERDHRGSAAQPAVRPVRSATTSACAPPGGRVCPTPTTAPSVSRITAPTGGLGVLGPRPPYDSRDRPVHRLRDRSRSCQRAPASAPAREAISRPRRDRAAP